MKVVINRCYGGFGLSDKAIMRYAELKGITLYADKHDGWNTYYTIPVNEANHIHEECREKGNFNEYNNVYFSTYSIGLDRTDPVLIQVIEELGESANGMCAKLKIIEIPDDIEWEVNEYDGMESIEEVHRSWS